MAYEAVRSRSNKLGIFLERHRHAPVSADTHSCPDGERKTEGADNQARDVTYGTAGADGGEFAESPHPVEQCDEDNDEQYPHGDVWPVRANALLRADGRDQPVKVKRDPKSREDRNTTLFQVMHI